jgi:hypothetical protein
MQVDETPIERKETAIRVLLSLLFVVIVQVVETILGVIILFELAYALITKQPPGERVRRFANRTLSYLYRIVRYLTYNEPGLPFPFSDFPSEVEPSAPVHERKEGGNEGTQGEAEG